MGEADQGKGAFLAGRTTWLLFTGLLVPAALATLLVGQALLFQHSTSATFDERIYLDLGLEVYQDGSFDGFVRPMVPPLPVLLSYWPCAFEPGRRVPVAELPRLHDAARLAHVLLIGVPLLLLVYGWLACRRGLVVGLVGGGLMALSPNVVAHAAVATTDACFALFALLALLALDRFQARPTGLRFLLCGAAIGLALAAKQSAFFLFPVAGVVLFRLLLVEMPRRGLFGWCKLGAVLVCRGLALFVLACLVNWACYGFGTAPLLLPGTAHPLLEKVLGPLPEGTALERFLETAPVPVSINTLLAQLAHGLHGHWAFLMGHRSQGGWWYFFPVAAVLKGTPTELALIALAVVLLFRPDTWRDPTSRLWVLAGGVFLGMCLLSALNLGVRYLSVLYPLLVLFVIDRGRSLVSRVAHRPQLILASAAALLLTVQALSTMHAAPHYLSYFSPLAGGSNSGHQLLVDSNLDWGQDLPSLKKKLDEMECERPLLAYFGTTPPEAYGLKCVRWDEADAKKLARCDYLALSATYLHGIGLPRDVFAPFRDLEPAARAAHTFFIYDLHQPEVRDALLYARQQKQRSDEEDDEDRPKPLLHRSKKRGQQSEPTSSGSRAPRDRASVTTRGGTPENGPAGTPRAAKRTSDASGPGGSGHG